MATNSLILILFFLLIIAIVLAVTFLFINIRLKRDLNLLDINIHDLFSNHEDNVPNNISSQRVKNLKSLINEISKIREEYLRDISHDFRTPLTKIRLAIERIDNEETKQQIISEVNIINNLIDEIIEKSRYENFKNQLLQKIELNKFIKSIISYYQNEQDYFSFTSKVEELEVTSDQQLLSRCVKNIIENSLHYSQLGTHSIDITIAKESIDNTNYAVIEIKDMGKQIKEDELKNMFKSFYRGDEAADMYKSGSGLGLAIVSSIAKGINLKLQVESPETGGLKFKLLLPL